MPYPDNFDADRSGLYPDASARWRERRAEAVVPRSLTPDERRASRALDQMANDIAGFKSTLKCDITFPHDDYEAFYETLDEAIDCLDEAVDTIRRANASLLATPQREADRLAEAILNGDVE